MRRMSVESLERRTRATYAWREERKACKGEASQGEPWGLRRRCVLQNSGISNSNDSIPRKLLTSRTGQVGGLESLGPLHELILDLRREGKGQHRLEPHLRGIDESIPLHPVDVCEQRVSHGPAVEQGERRTSASERKPPLPEMALKWQKTARSKGLALQCIREL